MALNIGVNVVETDGPAVPAIASAPVSVAGFLLRAERGIPDVPVAVRSPGDYAAAFGGFVPDVFGPHAMRGFFDNGGSEAYAVRVVDRANARAAQVTLADRKGTPTLQVTAGSRGREDPGAWGNALSVRVADHPRAVVAVPAQVAGTRTEPFALTDGQVLEIKVNGVAPAVPVTFRAADLAHPGAASAAEVAAAVARQTLRVRAAVTPDGRVLLASAAPGPASRLELAGSAAAVLGFTGPAATTDGALADVALAAVAAVGGLLPGAAVVIESRGRVVGTAPPGQSVPADSSINVAVDGAPPVPVVLRAADFPNGPGDVKPAELVAVLNRRLPSGTAGLDAAGRLVLMSDGHGPDSKIAITAGTVDATAALGLTGATPVPGAAQRRTLAVVAEDARYVTWTGALPGTGIPANAARIRSAEFDLIVGRDGAEVERFESLTMQDGAAHHVGTVVNDQASGSRYVTVADQGSSSGPVDDLPAPGLFRVGATRPGTDGRAPGETDFAGDPAARTGLYAFDTVDIQLLACPDSTAAGVAGACLGYAERRGDLMYVGTAPFDLDLEGVRAYAAPLRARKVFGALYAPWIEVLDPLDRTGAAPRLWVPPVGHVLGMYARVAGERGVWKAPAGAEAGLASALGVRFDMTDADHTGLVKDAGVNGVRALPGLGIVVDASRTLSTDTRWLFVNVRLLFNFVKSSLRDGLGWVAQEPNSAGLRQRVRLNVVTPFLLGLWRQGAFGSDPPGQTFTVKCDEENNPPAEVTLGNFRIEVRFYPVRPAETIVVTVGQQDGGASAADA
ncbi:phage tail sheath family protein [Actinomadura graeca]|uniref:Phage tail sheath family protein n=1 Tax=Actinomadura graeca TaxID=2750812 RepID=A0ABX8QSW4_9ACTN|nr:phage tail sheath C-terminal domain-containing protein [Actinomadura graeca]QXJ21274.1 phage tail sheath family protein [Actinomadura graeca]